MLPTSDRCRLFFTHLVNPVSKSAMSILFFLRKVNSDRLGSRLVLLELPPTRRLPMLPDLDLERCALADLVLPVGDKLFCHACSRSNARGELLADAITPPFEDALDLLPSPLINPAESLLCRESYCELVAVVFGLLKDCEPIEL